MADYTERQIRQEVYGEFLDAEMSEWDIEQLIRRCS
jgi:hypothetical protein